MKVWVPWSRETWIELHSEWRMLMILSQLARGLSSDLMKTMDTLNWCLGTVMGWMKANKLTNKVEALLLSLVPDYGKGGLPVLNKAAAPLKAQVWNLGVLLDPTLLLESQVSSDAITALYQFSLFLECDGHAMVTHAPINPRWHGCKALYVGAAFERSPATPMGSKAARMPRSVTRREHVTPGHKQLHRLSICL